MHSFPRLGRELFEKWVIMGSDPSGAQLTARELRRWERQYLETLRRIAVWSDGRPLLLRNTVSTGKADHLLRLFPEAKFIHLARNPYEVCPSFLNLYDKLLSIYRLDDYDRQEVEDLLMDCYARTMRKYLHDREGIPKGQLAELKFEDLERDPLGELERCYSELDLPGWERAKPRIAEYLGTLAGYRKNVWSPPASLVAKVEDRMGFAIEAFGYRRPETTA